VTFETRNLCKDTLFFTMDNAYLDNVKFMNDIDDIGIEAEDISSYLELFPNPVSEILNINLFANEQQPVKIELFDIQGKLMGSHEEYAHKGQNVFNIDMNGKTAGMYFVRISTSKGIYNDKILKK